jgi:hypothetical protein
LNETITRERTDVSLEDQSTEFGVFAVEDADNKEVAEESWDAELYALVSANAEKKVRCSWMDNAVVTLGDAMLAYPRTMTAADGPFLILIVNEMLANPVIEVEDKPEKQEGEAEEELAKLEDERASPENQN